MKHFVSYLLCAVSTRGLCCGDVTKFAAANPSDGGLSAEDRSALENTSRFHEVHSTGDLPPAVLALCDGGSDGKLAEPGQKWNATDSIIDPTLPGKRLIWAAVGRRVLRRALRARRDRAHVPHPGCGTREGRRQAKTGLARHRRPVQRLRGIYRRIAKRKAGRSHGLMRIERRARRSRPTKYRVSWLMK